MPTTNTRSRLIPLLFEESHKDGNQVVLEANAMEKSNESGVQGAVAVASADEPKDQKAVEEGDKDDQMPGLDESSDDEPRPLTATEWVETLGGEETSESESESEFEIMANEESSKGKKGFHGLDR